MIESKFTPVSVGLGTRTFFATFQFPNGYGADVLRSSLTDEIEILLLETDRADWSTCVYSRYPGGDRIVYYVPGASFVEWYLEKISQYTSKSLIFPK